MGNRGANEWKKLREYKRIGRKYLKVGLSYIFWEYWKEKDRLYLEHDIRQDLNF